MTETNKAAESPATEEKAVPEKKKAAPKKASGGGTATKKKWQELFYRCFLEEMQRDGYTPEQMSRYAWKPFQKDDLVIKGPGRDMDFSKVQVSPAEIRSELAKGSASKADAGEFLRDEKLVLLLLPGFTHHTLKFPAFIAQEELKKSSLDIVTLSEGKGGTTEETFMHRGGGVKLAYVAYPRSNACSDVIVEPIFHILDNSQSLRKWVLEEGRKIVFVGYSYGAPLSLELLAGINSKVYDDSFILDNTLALLTINGDIQGSYLADVVTNPANKINLQKIMKLVKLVHPIGWPLGLKTRQERDDNLGGAVSLGHEERMAHLDQYRDKVPADILYVSVCAFLPEDEYENGMLKNFDDWIMHKQSLASKPVSIYNDGQMVLEDCFIPDFPQVPTKNRIDLGAVRTHHWGVSWLTFNAGKNRFPRFAYYRALARTLSEIGVGNK